MTGGVHFPLKFTQGKALVYAVVVPNSEELLGLNFYLGV